MRRLLALALGFAYLVLLIEAIKLAVAWWRDEAASFATTDWLILASLPVLAWIWWQYLSPFGCGRGRCLVPEKPAEEREKDG